MSTRRQFSKYLLSTSAALLAPKDVWATVAQPLNQEGTQDCDLLIKGGTVIDAGQNLHSVLDVAVKDGKILELSSDIKPSRARKVVSAKGKIVTPGFVDTHVHVFEGIGRLGVNADHYCLSRGVTTVVDAGSTGAVTIAGFRKYIVNTSATRIFASLDIMIVGNAVTTELLEWINPQLAAQAAQENKPVVVGITARVIKNDAGSNDLEILRRAREAADASRLPLTVHIGGSYSPLKDILAIMRKGDVLTHCFTADPHGVLDQGGEILPEVWEARQRGILFAVGHAATRFSFKVAEKCLRAKFLPDVISCGNSAPSVAGPTFDMPTTLSKFLLLGLSIDKVIELVTIRPAQVFNFGMELGTLRPGSAADIAISELREGTFAFADGRGEKRLGRQKLVNSASIRDGKLFINQNEGWIDY